jgi:hypothetical protein
MNKRIKEMKKNCKGERCGKTKPNHVSYNLQWSHETFVNCKKHDLISTTKQTHTQWVMFSNEYHNWWFFLGEFLSFGDKKNHTWMLQRVFWECFCKIPHILKENYQKSWQLYIAFVEIIKTKCDFEKTYSSPRIIIM